MIDTIDQKSAGFILFKDEAERKYLLLNHGMDYWNFPKGKLETGENYMDAAKRELIEEAGIENIQIIEGFEKSFGYSFHVKEGLIKKVVKMYLAKYLHGAIQLSREHEDIKWFALADAMAILKFDNIKDSLKAADEYLSRLKNSNDYLPEK